MSTMKYSLITFLFAFLSFGMKAQKKSENLLIYGGFEEWSINSYTGSESPKGWYITNVHKKSEEIPPGSNSGQFSLFVYTSPIGYVMAKDQDKGTRLLDVKEGEKYKIKFWHKGSRVGLKFTATARLYSNSRKDITKEITCSTEWKEEEMDIQIPNGCSQAGFFFQIFDSGNEFILFDNISFTLANEEKPEEKDPTLKIQTQCHQHEIDLSWTGTPAYDTEWEIEVNKKEWKNEKWEMSRIKTIKNIKEPQYTIDFLDQNTRYNIKIRTLQGGKSKGYAETNTSTEDMKKGIDSPERIPYLRTIDIKGQCSNQIKAYYNELANKDAKITYKFDKKSIFPDSNQVLTLPRTKSSEYWEKHVLEVFIDEGEGRQWEIRYDLSIKNEKK